MVEFRSSQKIVQLVDSFIRVTHLRQPVELLHRAGPQDFKLFWVSTAGVVVMVEDKPALCRLRRHLRQDEISDNVNGGRLMLLYQPSDAVGRLECPFLEQGVQIFRREKIAGKIRPLQHDGLRQTKHCSSSCRILEEERQENRLGEEERKAS
jgi:hypothetical protein